MTKLTPKQRIIAKILLEAVAQKKERLFYKEDIADRIGVPAVSIGDDLGAISHLCYELNLPLLSGMAVAKNTRLPDFEGFGIGVCRRLHIYDEYDNAHYEDLVNQCIKDIQDCDKWHILTSYLGLDIKGISRSLDPIVKQEQKEAIEGARIQITATAYERNPENRAKCLQKWGTTCQICGFDAAVIYGKEFADMIHVHHKEPLGMVGEAHAIDPEKDLIPVCPNCHMILHAKKDGVYTPEEVEAMIKRES